MSETNFERWRNVEVAGTLGRILLSSIPMSLEEATFFWRQDISIPLELMPPEFWHDGELLRFGEENLGDTF